MRLAMLMLLTSGCLSLPRGAVRIDHEPYFVAWNADGMGSWNTDEPCVPDPDPHLAVRVLPRPEIWDVCRGANGRNNRGCVTRATAGFELMPRYYRILNIADDPDRRNLVGHEAMHAMAQWCGVYGLGEKWPGDAGHTNPRLRAWELRAIEVTP